jgi:hypothetical protein
MQFDHLGIPTTTKQPNQIWIEQSRVWVTDAHKHPFGVEWLRFESDSPVTGPLRDGPHLAFRVDNVEEMREIGKSMKTLVEPFDAGFCMAGFYRTDEAVLNRYSQYLAE